MTTICWVKKATDFDTCIKKGCHGRANSYYFFYRNNGLNKPRIGISVSKKISKLAVVRNKIKRQIRSFFYTHQVQIQKNVDLIIIVTKNYDLDSYTSNLLELKNKLRFLNRI